MRRPLQLIAYLLLLVTPAARVFAVSDGPLSIESVVLRPMKVAEVPAQQTGVLMKISVEEGQTVKKGQVLATLDPRAAHLAVQQAAAERDQAKEKAENRINIEYTTKSIEVAEAELQRSLESIEKFPKSISQSQLDVERLTVEKLQLERQQAEHELLLESFSLKLKENELAAARLALEKHRLQAPFSGRVVLVRGRLGEWLETGAPVLRLVAVESLRAEGFLPVEHASDALLGQPVAFVTQVDDKQVRATGTLKFVSPEMDPVTRQVRVWAEIDNQAGELKPGGQGTLKFE